MVPFAALTAFVDPSVRFGLQFEDGKAEAAAASPDTLPPSGPDSPGPGGGKPGPKAGEKSGGADKVVTLDAFRKK